MIPYILSDHNGIKLSETEKKVQKIFKHMKTEQHIVEWQVGYWRNKELSPKKMKT
jgi:hypothetical protein